ncbi:MAG: hypothetical protein HUK26_08450, partial [Duodenibacillus sp.]|nr:hypothetical protein [Duodenibacillus sp.]
AAGFGFDDGALELAALRLSHRAWARRDGAVVADPLAAGRRGVLRCGRSLQGFAFADEEPPRGFWLPAFSSRTPSPARGDAWIVQLAAVAPEAVLVAGDGGLAVRVTGCECLQEGSLEARLGVALPSGRTLDCGDAGFVRTRAGQDGRRETLAGVPAEQLLALLARAEPGSLLTVRYGAGLYPRDPAREGAFAFAPPEGWEAGRKSPAWWLPARLPGFGGAEDRAAGGAELVFEGGLMLPLLQRMRWLGARAGKLSGLRLVARLLQLRGAG